MKQSTTKASANALATAKRLDAPYLSALEAEAKRIKKKKDRKPKRDL